LRWPLSGADSAIGASIVMLRREGQCVNVKRVYRLYCQERLQVQRRRKRRGVAVERRPLTVPERPNQVWSIDFVSDSLETGRRIKCLTIVDDFTKEAIDIVVDHGISGQYVTRVLDAAARFRELPKTIRTDQGPEFHRQSHGHLGLSAWDRAALDRGRQAHAERLCREL
jgi:putative transposase